MAAIRHRANPRPRDWPAARTWCRPRSSRTASWPGPVAVDDLVERAVARPGEAGKHIRGPAVPFLPPSGLPKGVQGWMGCCSRKLRQDAAGRPVRLLRSSVAASKSPARTAAKCAASRRPRPQRRRAPWPNSSSRARRSPIARHRTPTAASLDATDPPIWPSLRKADRAGPPGRARARTDTPASTSGDRPGPDAAGGADGHRLVTGRTRSHLQGGRGWPAG